MHRHSAISHIRQLPARELALGALIHNLARRLRYLLASRRHPRDRAGDADYLRAAVRPEEGDGGRDARLGTLGGEFVDADYSVGDLCSKLVYNLGWGF